MKKKNIKMLLAVALSAALVACSDNNGDEMSAGASSRAHSVAEKSSSVKAKKPSRYPVDNLDATAAVVRVRTTAITKQDYEDWYNLRVRMFCEANRLSLRSKDDRLERVRRDSRNRCCNELIRREIIRQESERLGVKADPAKLAELQKRFMKQIKHGKEDFSKTESVFGAKDAALIRHYLQSVALEEACLDASATNDISRVTDEEVDEKINGIKEWNIRADASNAVQMARAKAAKAEILAGKFFYDVTTNCADLAKDDGKEWQVVELGDFDADEPIAKWLITAEQGDISDPIDLEDGLAIIGLRFKYKEDEEDPDAPFQYDLVRCTFYAFEKYEEVEDREQFRKDLLLEKRNAAMRKLGERLVAETPVEFPFGEEIFREKKSNTTKKAKNPAKKKPADVGTEREQEKKQ